jgi:hypothetical protein
VLDRVDVLELIGRQYGLATGLQLQDLGIARSTIRRARDRDVLVEVLPGVFTTAHRPCTFATNAMAVQLYFGDDCYLTGTTAGVYYGLREMPRGYVQAATTQRRSRLRTPKWVRLSSTPWIDDVDVVEQGDRLRIAHPHVMLAALASRFNAHRFAMAAEDTWNRGLITPTSLAEFVDAHASARRPGTARMKAWLGANGHRKRATQSGFEFDVVERLLAMGLPEPERQHPLVLLSGELIHLDIAWPNIRFAVEPGHSWFHRGTLREKADEARDRACGELGWHVSRYGEDARTDLRALAEEVARTHGVRRRQLGAAD